LSPKFPSLSVPYGCLVPRTLDGLLVAGRHICCDPSSHSFLREIPQCWLTGQAAGAAAALAVAGRCPPRAGVAAAPRSGAPRHRFSLRRGRRRRSRVGRLFAFEAALFEHGLEGRAESGPHHRLHARDQD
jgi:FAD dependent oxidoreductase